MFSKIKSFLSGHTKLLLGMFAAITILVLVSSYFFNIGSRMTSKYTPLIDAAMEIQLESMGAHLMLEEILSGDRGADIRPILIKLENAIWYAEAMIDGGGESRGHILAHRQQQFRREVKSPHKRA